MTMLGVQVAHTHEMSPSQANPDKSLIALDTSKGTVAYGLGWRFSRKSKQTSTPDR
jgi:hypothetical protein